MSDKKNSRAFVDLNNARLDEQREVMQDIVNNDHCPFCQENLRRYHKEPILRDGKFWIVTPNQWPYDHTKIHLLAIYKTHATTLQELDPEAGAELLQLFSEIAEEYKVPGGAIGMRFGDTQHSAGTVNHIHAQFITPDLEKPDFESIRFKIGQKKKV